MTTSPEALTASQPGVVPELRTGRSLHSLLLGGSLTMLAGTVLVSLLNFGYNIAVARMLGAADFSHAAVAVTLLMLVSSISLAFQMVCAKFVAKNDTAAGKAYVYLGLRRQAWIVGLLLGTSLIASSEWISSWLRMPSRWEIVVLAFGMTFYVPLGVKRGGLQGMCRFRQLSGNFILETFTKFVGAIILVKAGFGVMGAVAAISISEALAYVAAPQPSELKTAPAVGIPPSFHEGMQAITFFVGQVIINNTDVLMVKHFFRPEVVGVYAAVALVGRVLYFVSWSVVNAMFPVSAGAHSRGRESLVVLMLPLGMVALFCAVFILFLGLFPKTVLDVLFGSRFHSVSPESESLLALYATAAAGYAISVVLMAYEMSRRIANTGWLQLLFSGLVIAGISLFHDNIRQVIAVQQILMALLLICVAVPFFRNYRKRIQEAA